MFAYFGDLGGVMAVAASLTAVGGLLALSLEAGPEDCEWMLQSSLRYCHGETYLRRQLEQNGLDLLTLSREPIRRDGPNTISGLLAVARKRPSATVSEKPADLVAVPVLTVALN